jgi:uncharacterized membrane protein YhdT
MELLREWCAWRRLVYEERFCAVILSFLCVAFAGFADLAAAFGLAFAALPVLFICLSL